MPFSKSINSVIGKQLKVDPIEGFGWASIKNGEVLKDLNPPDPFIVTAINVLVDGAENRCVVCSSTIQIDGETYPWLAFIPRTASSIDLFENSIGCNILLTSERPEISTKFMHPHPDHVSTRAKMFARGFGRLMLCERDLGGTT